ncbi:HK97 family phage prohead protease [Mesorhizobium sp. B2-1-8]|uniref:HK97 family phage prohead protease n=1 Tax=Mesorhizobium sp. B2-1-8 TaxID=2589967 RepID=UPI0015E4243F|nr:HK97 family phage prohead protease [Mesorhizobium sp. B2-1-8]UCI17874.1 HK97 family phage prohead protease [Mesorhizobium sp. B2-1-8]
MSNVIQLPKFERDAEVRSLSFNERTNTIDVVWTTGAIVRRRNWTDGEFDEELVVSANAVRLARLNSGAPFLDTHDASSLQSVIGSVVPGSARIDSGRGVATVQLTRRDDAQGRIQDFRDGVIRNISVGYKTYVVEKQERKSNIPLMRVVDWEPCEISAVPIPADPGAQVRSDTTKRETFACQVREWRESTHDVRVRMLLRHIELGLPVSPQTYGYADALRSHNQAIRNRILRLNLGR